MDKWIIMCKHADDDNMNWKPARLGMKLHTFNSYEEAVARCNGKYVANLINGAGSERMRYGVARIEDVVEIDYYQAVVDFAQERRK